MPSTSLRQTVLATARHLVVKVGTQLLTAPNGQLDLSFFTRMANQVAALRGRGRGINVTLVSSGAVGSGMAELGRTQRPTDIADQQAVASIGQRRLMTHYHEAFAPHGLKVAQLLLTRGDFDDRVRFLNIRNCIARLRELGCVPIINENDTVAVDELRFGDNDMLAALICNALRADVLVLLTGVDGLLDGAGRRIDLVEDVAAVAGLARGKSKLGTGGMGSKLEAAHLVAEAGEVVVIANGREPDVLLRLLESQPLGTVFLPAKKKLDSRSRWIGLTKRPAGTLTVDAGAAAALRRDGKSLLAIGITGVGGEFERGAVLSVRGPEGGELARGLGNYSSEELRLIAGKKSGQFEKILGRTAYAEVIHRNNLVLTG
jgi:glutamate 5-kinase